MLASVVELLGCELAVPDHTTVSRRSAKLTSIKRDSLPRGPLHVLIDSTGLKEYSAGQWQAEKHGRSRRKWRKLHLEVNAHSGQLVAAILTDQDVDDASQVGPLLEQIELPIEQVTADGAYDGEPTYQTTTAHDEAIAVVIPPRDTHLLTIESLGRLGWQEVTGYSRRALVEATRPRRSCLSTITNLDGLCGRFDQAERWTVKDLPQRS